MFPSLALFFFLLGAPARAATIQADFVSGAGCLFFALDAAKPKGLAAAEPMPLPFPSSIPAPRSADSAYFRGLAPKMSNHDFQSRWQELYRQPTSTRAQILFTRFPQIFWKITGSVSHPAPLGVCHGAPAPNTFHYQWTEDRYRYLFRLGSELRLGAIPLDALHYFTALRLQGFTSSLENAIAAYVDQLITQNQVVLQPSEPPDYLAPGIEFRKLFPALYASNPQPDAELKYAVEKSFSRHPALAKVGVVNVFKIGAQYISQIFDGQRLDWLVMSPLEEPAVDPNLLVFGRLFSISGQNLVAKTEWLLPEYLQAEARKQLIIQQAYRLARYHRRYWNVRKPRRQVLIDWFDKASKSTADWYEAVTKDLISRED